MQMGGDASLTRLSLISNQLLRSMNAVAFGKQINRSSDNPAGYVSTQILEREAKIAAVKSKNAEREENYHSSNSTKLDVVANLTAEIDLLSLQASSSFLLQTEKDALQNQISQLSSQIDQTLKNANLGTAKDLGLDNLIINGNEEQRAEAANQTKNAFNSLLKQNIETGSQIRQTQRNQELLNSELLNIKSSQSSIADSDLMEESMVINKMNILRDLSLKSFNNAQNIQKAQLDLLG